MTNRHRARGFLFIFFIIGLNFLSISKDNLNNKQNLSKHNNPIKCIIFDVGDTLFKVNTWGIAKQIGLKDFFIYNYWDKQNPRQIQAIIFKILTKIKPYPPNHIHCYNHNLEIPLIMCQWLSGKTTSAQIYSQVKPYIQKLNNEGFFRNKRERRLVENTINAMFNPSILAKNMVPLPQAEKLLRDLKPQNYNLFILSNWDQESFKQLQHRGKNKIFSYFHPNNIIISGDIGINKPNPQAYKFLLKKFKYKAHECVYIDDDINNISTAKKLGMNAILIKDFNYKEVRKELRKLNIMV